MIINYFVNIDRFLMSPLYHIHLAETEQNDVHNIQGRYLTRLAYKLSYRKEEFNIQHSININRKSIAEVTTTMIKAIIKN